MSQLAAARRRLHSIRSLIRQGEPFSAVQVLREAVSIVFSEPLMKSEKREFQRMISDASYYIVCDQHIRKLRLSWNLLCARQGARLSGKGRHAAGKD